MKKVQKIFYVRILFSFVVLNETMNKLSKQAARSVIKMMRFFGTVNWTSHEEVTNAHNTWEGCSCGPMMTGNQKNDRKSFFEENICQFTKIPSSSVLEREWQGITVTYSKRSIMKFNPKFSIMHLSVTSSFFRDKLTSHTCSSFSESHERKINCATLSWLHLKLFFPSTKNEYEVKLNTLTATLLEHFFVYCRSLFVLKCTHT